ncbi:MAG: BON domain-containing protein [Nitrospiria bacterium]
MKQMTNLGLVLVVMFALTTGCQTMTGKRAGASIDDAGITATVKSKLVGEKMANLTRVDVDTNNGIVYLNGVVPTQADKQRAEQLANEAGAVKKVVNNLQVSESAGSPAE